MKERIKNMFSLRNKVGTSTHPNIMVLSEQIPYKRIKLVDTILHKIATNRPQKDEQERRTNERVKLGGIEFKVRAAFLRE